MITKPASIGIPIYDSVDVLDVTGPLEMFDWAGLNVELVAENAGLVKCRSGLTIQVQKSFAEASTYDVLWVPGGEADALAKIMYDPARTFLNFLVQKAKGARVVASVCEGALLLAAAGLLDGFEATTHWAFTPCFTERFPKVTIVPGHPRFHWDRDRLTGGGISAGLDEALELIRFLNGEAAAQDVQQTTQYYPDPPVKSEIPPADSCPLPPLRTSLTTR